MYNGWLHGSRSLVLGEGWGCGGAVLQAMVCSWAVFLYFFIALMV
jgi:hypothetical protein